MITNDCASKKKSLLNHMGFIEQAMGKTITRDVPVEEEGHYEDDEINNNEDII